MRHNTRLEMVEGRAGGGGLLEGGARGERSRKESSRGARVKLGRGDASRGSTPNEGEK